MMTMLKGSIVEQGPVGQLLTNSSHKYTGVVITDGRPHVVAEADLLAVPAQYGPSGPQGGTSA
jgi:ABC-type dipeptide/oligopeptide/nickel transport system ATPase component